MTLEEAVESLKLKFTSGNSIEVERATILRKEWDVMLPALTELIQRSVQEGMLLPPAETKPATSTSFNKEKHLKIVFSEKSVSFYENVAPRRWHPIHTKVLEAFSFEEIPEEILKALPEDDVTELCWFFEDIGK